MDDGWMPDAETKNRADVAAWNGGAAAAANYESRKRRAAAEAAAAAAARRRKTQSAIVLFDEPTRRKGLTLVWRIRLRRFWDVWCRAWWGPHHEC
jgi:hypothetical protein